MAKQNYVVVTDPAVGVSDVISAAVNTKIPGKAVATLVARETPITSMPPSPDRTSTRRSNRLRKDSEATVIPQLRQGHPKGLRGTVKFPIPNMQRIQVRNT